MIPALTTMVALLTLAVCGALIAHNDRNDRDGFITFLAVVAIIGAMLGTAYVWHLSVQVERDMAEAQRQIESIWQP